MAERPDLEYVIPRLVDAVVGKTITAVRVKKPVVLRMALTGGIERAIVGRRVLHIARRAHFVRFELDGDAPGVEIVVSPMLAGRFALEKSGAKTSADLAVTFDLSDGIALRYRDDVQMGKVYVIEKGRWDTVPGLAKVGVDVLDRRAFTPTAFREIARTRRDQVKVFLMDKSALDAMGNAYADEVMWEAGVHPKTMVRALDDAALETLRKAIVKVLGEARKTILERKPSLDEKLRDFVKVRNREGEPCPRCGTKVRAAGVHGHDAFFCPTCQPETRKSGIVDWRKLAR